MKKLRAVLKLKHEDGQPHRAIARACGIGVGTVSEYLRRVRCVMCPDKAQQVVLSRLGVKLPQRLPRIDEEVEM